mmetsp:Transcript_132979/g.230609  ORF Transcript_132979/g.230609 Transcript_132979/m.230609 type:complete len:204 (+) Transcript_132979:2617-3228(+)
MRRDRRPWRTVRAMGSPSKTKAPGTRRMQRTRTPTQTRRPHKWVASSSEGTRGRSTRSLPVPVTPLRRPWGDARPWGWPLGSQRSRRLRCTPTTVDRRGLTSHRATAPERRDPSWPPSSLRARTARRSSPMRQSGVGKAPQKKRALLKNPGQTGRNWRTTRTVGMLLHKAVTRMMMARLMQPSIHAGSRASQTRMLLSALTRI